MLLVCDNPTCAVTSRWEEIADDLWMRNSKKLSNNNLNAYFNKVYEISILMRIGIKIFSTIFEQKKKTILPIYAIFPRKKKLKYTATIKYNEKYSRLIWSNILIWLFSKSFIQNIPFYKVKRTVFPHISLNFLYISLKLNYTHSVKWKKKFVLFESINAFIRHRKIPIKSSTIEIVPNLIIYSTQSIFTLQIIHANEERRKFDSRKNFKTHEWTQNIVASLVCAQWYETYSCTIYCRWAVYLHNTWWNHHLSRLIIHCDSNIPSWSFENPDSFISLQ